MKRKIFDERTISLLGFPLSEEMKRSGKQERERERVREREKRRERNGAEVLSF